MRKFTLATSVALLLLGAGASPSFARGGKKDPNNEMSSQVNKQFDWENKVVGPKEGLDHDKVAATRERGIREEQERTAKGTEKVKKVVADPSTATIPTQDIAKPADPVERKKKVAAAPAPRQRDAPDNLPSAQGVKPHNPAGGGTNGLDSVLAWDDKGSKGKKAAAKKTRRGRN